MSRADLNGVPDNELQIRVYIEDTDAGGVVFYVNYLKFLERGRTEWLRRLGVDQTTLLHEEQRLFVVKQLDIQYRRPARLDNLIIVRSVLTKVGQASLQFHQTASLAAGSDQTLLCSGTVTVCCVDAATFKLAGIFAQSVEKGAILTCKLITVFPCFR